MFEIESIDTVKTLLDQRKRLLIGRAQLNVGGDKGEMFTLGIGSSTVLVDRVNEPLVQAIKAAISVEIERNTVSLKNLGITFNQE